MSTAEITALQTENRRLKAELARTRAQLQKSYKSRALSSSPQSPTHPLPPSSS